MTEAVKGKERAEVRELFDKVHALLTQTRMPQPMPRSASSPRSPGVREFPVRVKCASLCWHTLNAALASTDAAATVSTE